MSLADSHRRYLGRLTGTFTDFFKQGAQETEDEFVHAVNETVYVTAYMK